MDCQLPGMTYICLPVRLSVPLPLWAAGGARLSCSLGLFLAFARLYILTLQELRPRGSSAICTARAPQLARGSQYGGPGEGSWGVCSAARLSCGSRGDPPALQAVLKSQQRRLDYKWRGI